MSETVSINIDMTGAKQAGAELEQIIREDIAPATELLQETFSTLANTIEDELERAARRGELSMKRMVQEILNDLAKLAAQKIIREPLQNAINTILQGAIGGGLGAIAGRNAKNAASHKSNVTINMIMPTSSAPETFPMSPTQVAASLHSALSKAARNS
ncbi:MAG: phage tail tape measure C-terminal domain-containing protein [bacterium]